MDWILDGRCDIRGEKGNFPFGLMRQISRRRVMDITNFPARSVYCPLPTISRISEIY